MFAHCFTYGKDIFAASRIAEDLAARNIAVLRFDFTGIGGSEGEFANTNFSSNVSDLVAAAAYLRQNHGAPSLLIGHSLGGAAVLAAVPRMPDAAAVVTIGAPASPAHVTHNFAANLAEVVEKGTAEVTLAGRTFAITKQFLDDLAAQSYLDDLAKMRKALLVCHAPQANMSASRMRARSSPPLGIPKAFSRSIRRIISRERAVGIYVADVFAAWASRYLPVGEPASALPEGVVEVSETRSGRFQQRVRAGHHLLVARAMCPKPRGQG